MTDVLKRLAQRARGELPPRVDVVDPVLAEIRRRQRPVRPPTPAWLARFALVAAAPAAVVLVMTIQLIYTMTDPLNGLFMAATFIP